MNVYSILVHPSRHSLNGTLFDTANELFVNEGHQVQTLELFSIEQRLIEAARTMYDNKTKQAGISAYLSNWISGTTTEFVRDEIERVKSADLLFIQSPIWVYSMPALFKSYMEQIFLFNQFFRLTDTASADNFSIEHLTTGKKVLLSLTVGGSKEMVSHVLGDSSNITHYPKSVFENFLGYEFLTPHITWGTTSSRAPNKQYIDEFITHLSNQTE